MRFFRAEELRNAYSRARARYSENELMEPLSRRDRVGFAYRAAAGSPIFLHSGEGGGKFAGRAGKPRLRQRKASADINRILLLLLRFFFFLFLMVYGNNSRARARAIGISAGISRGGGGEGGGGSGGRVEGRVAGERIGSRWKVRCVAEREAESLLQKGHDSALLNENKVPIAGTVPLGYSRGAGSARETRTRARDPRLGSGDSWDAIRLSPRVISHSVI